MIPNTSYHNLKRALAPDTILILDISYRSIWYSINGQEDVINSPEYDFSSSLNGKRFMPMDEHIKNELGLDRDVSDGDRVEYIKKMNEGKK